MIVVSDASPIIGLAAVDQLDLLRELYGEILVPTAVHEEVAAGEPEAPGTRELRDAAWIRTRHLDNTALVQALMLELDRGEAEAIALAVETDADLLLVDERRARIVASRFGCSVLGVLGVLIEAKQRELLSAVKPVLEALEERAGFRISEALRTRVLEVAGEVS